MLAPLLATVLLLAAGETALELNHRRLDLLAKGDFDGAVALLKRAAEASDDDPTVVRNLSEARNRRGIDHLEGQRLRKAIVDFDAAAERA